MNCSTVCLLTSYIKLLTGPDTLSCSYCIDSRSSIPDCYDNILECAYKDPASLFICLNVYENAGNLITHVGRCVSYDQFYISDNEILSLNSGMCKYGNVQQCECSECPTRTTTDAPTTTQFTQAPFTTTRRKSHHKHHHSQKPEHHHPLAGQSGQIGTVSAYQESQVAATSSLSTIFSLIIPVLWFFSNQCGFYFSG